MLCFDPEAAQWPSDLSSFSQDHRRRQLRGGSNETHVNQPRMTSSENADLKLAAPRWRRITGCPESQWHTGTMDHVPMGEGAHCAALDRSRVAQYYHFDHDRRVEFRMRN